MPRRIEQTHNHWTPSSSQQDLVDRATTVTCQAGTVEMRLACVPLFRTSDQGLEQAIRVRLDGERTGLATIRARSTSGAIAELVLGPESSTGHLFLPEVQTATGITITITIDGATTTTTIDLLPQRKFTVHLIHHSHFDYGYTDPQAMVLEHQLRYIDAALDLITATDHFAPADQFRWNVEVTFPLRHWLANRPQALQEEFFTRVREGRIEINGLPFSMHTEVYSIDELAWGMQFTDELRNAYGVEIVSAIQSDVPGATLGLLNLLTSSDIKYFSVAHNYAGRSIPHLLDGQDLTKPFWWQGADGKRVLVWMSDTPHGVAYMDGVIVGTSIGTETTRQFLPEYLANLANLPYPYGKSAFGWHDIPADHPVTKKPYPYDIMGLRVQNGFADNAPPTMVLAETVQEWNATYAWPKLRISTNRDFFSELEQRVGDQINTFTGDWTDWWVDGVGSAALPLGLNRQTQATIRTAQTLHTLAGNTTAQASINQVYEEAALFDEHTWGSADPWDDKLETFDSGALQWGKKASFAYNAADHANALLISGMHHLFGQLGSSPDALASLVVFNPTARPRWDMVRVFIPLERFPIGTTASLLNAATGEDVPYRLTLQGNWGFRAKGQWIEFAAENLPPLGYHRYDLVATDTTPGALAITDPFTLESPHYRVSIDPASGYIAAIIDLDDNRNLVDPDAPFGFNEYIYDQYTTAPGFNHLSGRVQDVDLGLFGDRSTAGYASVTSRTSDGVSDSITLRLHAAGVEYIESTISLPRALKRIDITNRLVKIGTTIKESVYFAFPFAVEDSDPLYEITGGMTTQASPHVPGSCQHMFAIRHWIALGDDHGSVAWASAEAPLVELGTIALPYSPFPSTIPADRTSPATIYSWAMNNMWDTNFPPSQHGEMLFRYAMSSESGLDRAHLGILTGETYSAPLVGFTLRPGTNLAPATRSWLKLDHPHVSLVTVRPGRAGGNDLLLHSIAPEPVSLSLDIRAFAATTATLGNHLGRNTSSLVVSDGQVEFTISSGALVSLHLA